MRCRHGRVRCRVCGGDRLSEALAAHPRPASKRVPRGPANPAGIVKRQSAPRTPDEFYERQLEAQRALWLQQNNLTPEQFAAQQNVAQQNAAAPERRNVYGAIIPRPFGQAPAAANLETHIANTSKQASANYLNQAAVPASAPIKAPPSGAINTAFGILSRVTTSLASTSMPPNAQRVIDGCKSIRIVRMDVQRAPIAKALGAVLNLVSGGQWNQAKDTVGVDTLFHLCLHVNGMYQFEKEARVGFKTAIDKRADGETMAVPIVHPVTIGELVDNAKNVMGAKFFSYDAFSNNCQDFVLGVLAASNLLTPALHSFIKQPAAALLNHNPSYLAAVARTATNLGNIADRVMQGGQRRRLHARGPKSRKYGGKKASEYAAEQKAAYEKGLAEMHAKNDEAIRLQEKKRDEQGERNAEAFRYQQEREQRVAARKAYYDEHPDVASDENPHYVQKMDQERRQRMWDAQHAYNMSDPLTRIGTSILNPFFDPNSALRSGIGKIPVVGQYISPLLDATAPTIAFHGGKSRQSRRIRGPKVCLGI